MGHRNISSSEYYNNVQAAASFVVERLGSAHVAIVLGSGLGGLTSHFITSKAVLYTEIPSMPSTTVAGHSGKLVMGELPSSKGTLKVLCFSGRVHAYEGISMEQISFSSRLAAAAGCKVMFLTCSAGGTQPGMEPGSITMIRDHIRWTNMDPLCRISTDRRFGDFPWDSSRAYSDVIAEVAREAANRCEITLYEGAYGWSPGPTYETPSEVHAGIKAGVSAFGMSTVPEVASSHSIGMEVFVLALCTNLAAGLVPHQQLLHEDVTEVAKAAGCRFEKLILRILHDLDVSTCRNEVPRILGRPGPDASTAASIDHSSPKRFSSAGSVRSDAEHLQVLCNALPGFHHSVVIFAPSKLSGELHKHMKDTLALSMQDLSQFRSVLQSASSRCGRIDIGTLDNARAIIVECRYRDGFSDIESDHLIRMFHVLGFRQIIQVVEANISVSGSPVSVASLIQDFVQRTQNDTHPVLAKRSSNYPAFSSSSSSLKAMIFPGPSMPSSAERKLAENSGCSMFIVTSVAPIRTAMGLNWRHNLAASFSVEDVIALIGPSPENAAASCFHKALEPHVDCLQFAQEDPDYVHEATEFCRSHFRECSVALLVDPPFNTILDSVQVIKTVSARSIPHWPNANSQLGSRWNFSLAQHQGGNILCIHANSLPEFARAPTLYNLTFAIRVLKELNVKSIVAAGEVYTTRPEELPLGEVAFISDHINLSGRNPLCGPNNNQWGVRFPDMSNLYSQPDNLTLQAVVAYAGPSALISPANAAFASFLGANAICDGMVPESIVARHMDMAVTYIVLVSGDALQGRLKDHHHNQQMAKMVLETIQSLLSM